MTLQDEFRQICDTFFPQWNRDGWECRECQNLNGSCGECCTKSKTVKIAADVDNLTLVLIHEICHAVGGSGHEAEWQNSMEDVAVQAQKIGRSKLAGQIREEVRQYQETPITTEEDIYERLDEILARVPNITMIQVVDTIRSDFMISISCEEFLTKYERFQVEFANRQQWTRPQA